MFTTGPIIIIDKKNNRIVPTIECENCEDEIFMEDKSTSGFYECPNCDAAFYWKMIFSWSYFNLSCLLPNFIMLFGMMTCFATDGGDFLMTISYIGAGCTSIGFIIKGIVIGNRAMIIGAISGVLISPLIFAAGCFGGIFLFSW